MENLRLVTVYGPINKPLATYKEEATSDGPHILSEATCNKVREELGLLEGQPKRRIAYAGQRVAENTFAFLQQNDKITYDLLGEWLAETYEEVPEQDAFERCDAATMGMALVFQAFSFQYGPAFFESFKKVEAEVKEKVLSELTDHNRTILGRVERRDAYIEPFQTHLGGIIDDFERYMVHPNDMKEGAARAYGMVRAGWKSMGLGV